MSLELHKKMSDNEEINKRKSKLHEKYISKIKAMMYTSGDVTKPRDDSAEIMENILRDQINTMLIKAEKTARLQGSKVISHEAVLFLLRRNKAKLQQLLMFLKVLDMRFSTIIQNATKDDDDAPLENPKQKKIKKCMEFLSTIEDCEEFTSLLDEENYIISATERKRLERRNFMGEKMKIDEYEYFVKMSQISFCPIRKMSAFSTWLLQDKVTKFALTELALIIIGFIIRDIISMIIDKVLAIRASKLQTQKGSSSPNSADDSSEADSKVLDASANIEENVTFYFSGCRDKDDSSDDANKNVNTDVSDQPAEPVSYLNSSEIKVLLEILEMGRAITPSEIIEAFGELQEPSPLFHAFANGSEEFEHRFLLSEPLPFEDDLFSDLEL